MFNTNLLKSGKIKLLSVMLSFTFVFLSIPTFPAKAVSDFDCIQASTATGDTYTTASVCTHTYQVITGYQAPGGSYTHIHYGLCTVTVVYNILVLQCTKCGHILDVISSVDEIHSITG